MYVLLLIQFLSEEWMAIIYPYNVFYLIDLDQSVNKSRDPHTPHYDINGVQCFISVLLWSYHGINNTLMTCNRSFITHCYGGPNIMQVQKS